MRIENGVLKSLTYEELCSEELIVPEGVLRIDWDFSEEEMDEIRCQYGAKEFKKGLQDKIKEIQDLISGDVSKRIHNIYEEDFDECFGLNSKQKKDEYSDDFHEIYAAFEGREINEMSFTQLSEEDQKKYCEYFIKKQKAEIERLESEIESVNPAEHKEKHISQNESLPCIESWAHRTEHLARFKTLKLPNTLQEIGEYAFASCRIENLIIPESVDKVERGAFYENSDLKQVSLPTKLKVIPKACFEYCKNLERIIIPSSVETIEESAFEKCPKLHYIGITNSETRYSIKMYENSFDDGVNINRPKTDKDNPSKTLKDRDIPNRAELTAVKVPGKYKKVGEYAFADCQKLESIIIDEGVEEIGFGAFAFCEGLKNVTLPKTLKKISEDAFVCCTSIEKIILPDGITTIDRFAFEECTSLTELKFPKKLKEISEYIAYKCQSLSSVTLPKGIEKIGKCAFAETDLQSAELPPKLQSIGNMAFADTKLQHISFPKTLEKMGVQSFAQCKGLFDVELNEGLKTIPEYCFYGCTDLQSIHIPTTVKSIEKQAFAKCEKLSNVYYDGDANDVRRDITCFNDCPASALSLNAKEEKTEVIDGTSYSVLEDPKKRTLKDIARSIGIIRNRQKNEKEK